MISKTIITLFVLLPGLVLSTSADPGKSAAPVACERSILIKAPPETVWKLLTDINGWPRMFKNVSAAKMNGPLRPGVTFGWKSGGIPIHSTLRVVNAGQELAWTGRACTIAAVHDWRLRAVGGGTELTVTECMSGLVARLFKTSLNRSLGKDMTESLRELKLASENSNVSAATPGAAYGNSYRAEVGKDQPLSGLSKQRSEGCIPSRIFRVP